MAARKPVGSGGGHPVGPASVREELPDRPLWSLDHGDEWIDVDGLHEVLQPGRVRAVFVDLERLGMQIPGQAGEVRLKWIVDSAQVLAE